MALDGHLVMSPLTVAVLQLQTRNSYHPTSEPPSSVVPRAITGTSGSPWKYATPGACTKESIHNVISFGFTIFEHLVLLGEVVVPMRGFDIYRWQSKFTTDDNH